MRRYAEGTSVPAERSEAEIRKLLERYGASDFALRIGEKDAAVAFRAKGRNVLFTLPMPAKVPESHWSAQQKRAQEIRRLWRSLALSIKAKLEVVASGITEFETEFLGHIVMPGGATIADAVRPRIAEMYKTGRMLPLLPEKSGEPEA